MGTRGIPIDVVAIDGPAGAGKSSVSRAVAEKLGFAFLDTGAMYRAATWWVMENEIDCADHSVLVHAVESMPLRLEESDSGLRVFVDGIDISQAIRTPEVTRSIRKLDGIPGVRNHLLRLQQEFATRGPTVAEGRDMGTVVFPAARSKIYLDASLECRARRRAQQLEAEGTPFDFESLQEEIRLRDENDKNRAVAPLCRAEDAWLLDTSDMTQAEVIDAILEHVREAA